MLNPYVGRNNPVNRKEYLCGRENEVHELQNAVLGNRHITLIGVEGVGKTSLLNCAFDFNFRRFALKEHGVFITDRFSFPVGMTGERFFAYLLDEIRSSLDIVESEEQASLIRQKMEKEKSNGENGGLDSVVRWFEQSYGWRVVLVFDSFERFTSSTDITVKHHDALLKLVDEWNFRFCVATNTDLERSSLPRGSTGSILLQRLAGSGYPVKGLGRSTPEWFTIYGEKDTRLLSERLYPLTGGNPALLSLAAAQMWEMVQVQEKTVDKWINEDWEMLSEKIYQQTVVQSLFKHWCERLTSAHIDAMNYLIDHNDIKDSTDTSGGGEDPYSLLEQRGLLTRGHGGKFPFSSSLFRKYVKDGKAAKAAQESWKDVSDGPSSLVPVSTRPGIGETNMIDQVWELLFQSLNRPERLQVPGFEERFANIVAHYPDEFPKALLDALGDTGRVELKNAVCFRAIWSSGEMAQGKEAEIALFFYSKVLERRVKDCFFEYCKKRYPTFQVSIGRKPWSTLTRTGQTTLGDYSTLMQQHEKEILADCAKYRLTLYPAEVVQRMISTLDKARLIRNKVLHSEDEKAVDWAKTEVTGDDLTTMHAYLLGKGYKLLQRLDLGKRLLACETSAQK